MPKKLKRVFLQDHTKITITHGGGMGGCRNDYVMCQGVDIDGSTISFSGWPMFEDNRQHVLHYWDIVSDCLLVFDISHWPKQRIDSLVDSLDRGLMEVAMMEYRRTEAGNTPTTIKKVAVTACGHWSLVKPHSYD